jgi:hypothetical protein
LASLFVGFGFNGYDFIIQLTSPQTVVPFALLLFSFRDVKISKLPQEPAQTTLRHCISVPFYARFLWQQLFSPHPVHGAMQILVHVDVALHRKI